jgi:hypothetical protein
MSKNETYLIFIVQGYKLMTEQGQLIDIVTIELIDESAENAIMRARKLIQKENYRVSNIIEKKICLSPQTSS